MSKAKISLEKLMTSAEVAELLQLSAKTLANWRYQGKIPFLKVHGFVRYRREDLELWLKHLKTQGYIPFKNTRGRG